GYILYWGREIDRQHLKLYKIERIISALIYIILGCISVLGIGSLVYSIYLVNIKETLLVSFWFDKANVFHLYFWLSVFADLYLIYYSAIAKDKKQKVLVRKYKSEAEAEVIAPPPLDWPEIKHFKHKFIISIDKSFADESLQIVEKAFEVAAKYKAMDVGPVHFLIAALLISQKVQNIFNRLGVDLNSFAGKIGRVAANYARSEGQTVFSSASIAILLKAYRLAYMNKLDEVGAEEIVSEAVRADKMIQEVLYDLNIDMEKLENVVVWFRISKLLYKQWQTYRASSQLKSKTGIDRAMTAIQTAYLNQFAEDLTLQAKMGYLDLCIDREKEFNEIFRVLEGSSIKGIVMVGEPGTGKTAIIEGLAQKMIADDVPEFLQDKRLVSLSISRLISGASATDAQERLLICLNEIIAAGNVILYIDNIHDLIGIAVGGGEGLGLAEVLNEALSKNLFICLSSSTPQSYSRYVENTGLGSVLKKIDVTEPDLNNAIQILEGKVNFIESKNNIYFSYDALEQAVKLTDRYIHDHFLPYKAISLLEEVAVSAKKHKGANSIVLGNDVAALLSEKINMPVAAVTEKESEKLLRLEEILHERIIDQEEAVSAVANSLRRARAELRDVKRPIANLLFLGPTGVGKTELAKAIAEVYFSSEDNMVRLDMSEYQEKDSVNRLLGAPPGYEGAGGGGQLTEAVRKNPFSLLLLDELEKAHSDILNLFLQVMEDGRLTDSSGRTVDFTNVILIATSNAQTSFIQEKVKLGLPIEEIKKQLLETELKQYFKPEFLNRFDNIIIFKPLGLVEVVQIARLMLKSVAKNLEAKGVNFKASEDAINELAQAGFDPQFGARPLRRVIQERVDNALANYLLTGKIGRRDVAILEKGGLIRVEKARAL
ncbi:MAG: ATP-dependent Clp protease ATP-binding subunit, partial [Candidatus Parcubacteria bacterium]|nr:ATP-dependent Clp protease ATP-binding subunit [Candidatus Parcubacteria bacterium]